jgi:hypothetical protein
MFEGSAFMGAERRLVGCVASAWVAQSTI